MSTQNLDLAGLCTSEGGRLRRLIHRIVGNRSIAEDIAQDTFLKLAGRALAPSDRGLVFRTGQTMALDHLRARKVRDLHARSAIAGPPEYAPSPDVVLEAREDLGSLMDALAALPQRTQRIFLLSRLDGLPHPAIARALGVSLSTVEKDMAKALDLCRAWRRQRDGD
ncbi:RNA polymerase sigma factor [Bosea sp. PAMC 26642]|uniref:RNA polymerase sigma factor n=1 Tax=Bosea sp. (strain PAMC 26642) TaxID=1792307 RepID=UPI000770106F|nr:sigma-70 family RNA polymerase sigma factor [Bosea sp. PAMC 26642]AMJ62873.1 hypothetical protein AXW83_23550 [Bosea sp. PAMC 26642]